MAKIGKSLSGGVLIQGRPKKSRQGQGKNSKFASNAAGNHKKKTRGQGR